MTSPWISPINGLWLSLALSFTVVVPTVFAQANDPDSAAAEESEPLPGLISTPRTLPGGRRWQMFSKDPGLAAGGVDFSPDGRQLAIGTAQIVRIYDVTSGEPELKRLLVGHLGMVRAVRFNPAQTRIATASLDGTVRIWTVAGKVEFVYRDHEDGVVDVAWHPDGNRLASASLDGTLRIWTVDGKTAAILKHEAPVNAVAWNPNGKLLAFGCEDRTIRYCDAEGQPGTVIQAHVGPVKSVAWNRQGTRLLSCDRGLEASDQEIADVADMMIWDRDGRLVDSTRVNIPLSHCCWSPNGRRAIAGGSRSSWMWHVGENKEAIRMPGLSVATPVAWRPTSDMIAAGLLLLNGDGEMTTRIPLRHVELDSVRFSPDGSIFGAGRSDRTFYLFNYDGERIHHSPQLDGGNWVTSICWSPDGSWFVPGQRYAKVLQRYDPAGNPFGDPIQLPGDMRSVDWSPDGELIVAGGDNMIVSLVDLRSEKAVAIGKQTHGITQVRFTPDQQQVCSAGFDGRVRFWSLDGKPLKVLEAVAAPIRGLAWSSDGDLMATGHEDGTIRFWNAEGKVPHVVRGHGDFVESVDFHPDGSLLVSASRDNSLRIWNRKGELQSTLHGHGGAVIAVHWPADAEQIISCGDDGSIRIWDVDSGRTERLILFGQSGDYVTLNAEGRVLFGEEKLLETEFLFVAEDDQGRLARTPWADIRAALVSK